MNCQSIKNKRCELQATTEYIKPDIIIGNESWLAPEYANSEIFMEGFNSMVYRNDRNKNCGGVFISVRDRYTTSEINKGRHRLRIRRKRIRSLCHKGSSNCEIVWTELQSQNEKSIILGSFYRPPNEKSIILGSFYRPPNTGIETLQELRKSLENLPKNSEDKIIILAGDFNLPHINWKNNTIKPGGNQLQLHQELLDIVDDFDLEQMQTNPTRQDNVLDLYFTNIPSLVKSCETIPGISDHDMLVIDSDLKPTYNKPKRRKVYIYKGADMNTTKRTWPN